MQSQQGAHAVFKLANLLSQPLRVVVLHACGTKLNWLCDFYLWFCYVMYYIYWCIYIEPSLHPWGKTKLVMMHNFLNVMLNSVREGPTEFCICVHQGYWFVVFFFCWILISFQYQGNAGFTEWIWEDTFLSPSMEKFEEHWCVFSSKGLVEFSCKFIWSWAFPSWKSFNYCLTLIACVDLFRFCLSSLLNLGGSWCALKKSSSSAFS